MAANLCCITEQRSRSSSPDFPNVRVTAATPARHPLLPRRIPSYDSRFTSAQSDELHELRQIFENVTSHDFGKESPTERKRAPRRGSKHSLQKIRNAQALIKKRLSRDFKRPKSTPRMKEVAHENTEEQAGTVVVFKREGPNTDVKITKQNLRNDLLSTKKPEEGGYDSDAEILDDIAKKLAKRIPSKRTSIHSVDWTLSTNGSRGTPTSGTSRHSRGGRQGTRQYDIYRINTGDSAHGPFGHVASSPSLRNCRRTDNRKLRRSHSATSVETPGTPMLEPLRLPSISSVDAQPWSLELAESLRLSQFPLPPGHKCTYPKLGCPLQEKQPSLYTTFQAMRDLTDLAERQSESFRPNAKESGGRTSSKPNASFAMLTTSPSLATMRAREISASFRADRSQTSLKPSGSLASIRLRRSHASIQLSESCASIKPSESRVTIRPTAYCTTTTTPAKTKEAQNSDEHPADSRTSIHLYDMRISHHLRSASLLSSAASERSPKRLVYSRTPSNLSVISQLPKLSGHQGRARQERKTSSTGFASTKIPLGWGNVVKEPAAVNHDSGIGDEASSIYSSRLQSATSSAPASILNVSRVTISDESTPKPFKDSKTRNSSEILTKSKSSFKVQEGNPSMDPFIVEAANSASVISKLLVVASDKSPHRKTSFDAFRKSRFKEEFSPPPLKKKSKAPKAVLKLFRYRETIRSRSEANLGTRFFDGPVDSDNPRQRKMSRSTMSLQAEQEAIKGHHHDLSPMWEKALKNYQEERSVMFLSPNKAEAVSGSPFRERSSSLSRSCAESLGSDEVKKLPSLHDTKDISQGSETPNRPHAVVAQEAPITPTPITQELKDSFHAQKDSTTNVGSWGRYPSHTRAIRTGSANSLDQVQARDFAFETALKFAEDFAREGLSSSPTNPSSKKKRRARSRMSKSHSMTFGKTFLKNYARIFRSQSTEYLRHGHGHRSSIAAGGSVEHPELEIFPSIWRTGIVEEHEMTTSLPNRMFEEQNETLGKLQDDEGESSFVTAAERTPGHTPGRDAENRNFNIDGAAEGEVETEPTISTATVAIPEENSEKEKSLDRSTTHKDKARIWSHYYTSCISSPLSPTRLSIDELRDWGSDIIASASKRLSTDGNCSRDLKRSSADEGTGSLGMRFSDTTMSLPARLRHGRVESVASGGSVGGISVRRSTADLVELFLRQERVERERGLGLVEGVGMPSLARDMVD